MPWQRQVADVALEVDDNTGRLAYRTVVVIVPRQSGKTTLLLPVKCQRALGFGGRQRIISTAQTRRDALEKWTDDELPMLEQSPLARLFRVRKVNGSEALLWRNGSIAGFVATTKQSGHGKTLDLAVVDEAFAQKDLRLEQALRPTMITRPEPQLWIVSTGGDEDSVWLRQAAKAGRSAVAADHGTGIAYFEWSADPDADPNDPATWWSCMPALGITVTEHAVRSEQQGMDPVEFARAFLNIWPIDLDDSGSDTVIDTDHWATLTDPSSEPAGPVAFAVDVTPGGAWAAIALAGAGPDGRRHVELVDHRPGTRWVTDRIIELRDRWSPSAIAINPTSTAGSLIADLEAHDVEITKTSQREYAQACGAFVADVNGDPHPDDDGEPTTTGPRIVHLGQGPLDDAIAGATQREIGALWVWNRQNVTVDISPLVAATVALHAHLTAEPPLPVFAY
ncbi:MAG: terminase large subunit domain-containing protein [Acidimicrobiales bacterium]